MQTIWTDNRFHYDAISNGKGKGLICPFVNVTACILLTATTNTNHLGDSIREEMLLITLFFSTWLLIFYSQRLLLYIHINIVFFFQRCESYKAHSQSGVWGLIGALQASTEKWSFTVPCHLQYTQLYKVLYQVMSGRSWPLHHHALLNRHISLIITANIKITAPSKCYYSFCVDWKWCWMETSLATDGLRQNMQHYIVCGLYCKIPTYLTP